MKSIKKNVRVWSALAAATFAVKSASAATLTLYYGNTSGATKALSDGIYTGTGVSTANAATGNLTEATQITPNVGAPTTINIPVGDYVSIAINAVVTNNPNPDGGVNELTYSQSQTNAQPYNLGLAALGIRVPVSANDADGHILQPLAKGPSYGLSLSGTSAYDSYANVNQQTNEPGGPAAPQWNASTSPGDVEMNSGSVSADDPIDGINQSVYQTASGMNELQQFSGATSAYSNSTEFFNGLLYKGEAGGSVTLSPHVDSMATQYWSLSSPAAENGGTSRYHVSFFGNGDTIGTLPVLVINVSQPIVALTGDLNISNYGASSGALAPLGNGGLYPISQITDLNDVTNFVQVSDYLPSYDEIFLGLDVQVNGNQATPAQLATLIDAIDGDGFTPASLDVSASTVSPTGAFPSDFNLFLERVMHFGQFGAIMPGWQGSLIPVTSRMTSGHSSLRI